MSKKRVTAYLRLKETSLNETTAYTTLCRNINEYVAAHEDWELTEVYMDEGGAKKRTAFARLLDDCKAGKLDVIIAQNVGRFGKDVLEAVNIAQELARRTPPVGVIFRQENIDSLAPDNEAMLRILRSIALHEKEMRSMAMRYSWQIRKERGLVGKAGASNG
jgi:DNA invertase Pin-like site-specific DNA recombinase